MKRSLLSVTAAAALALVAGAAQADTNVALGAAVSLSGPDFGNSGSWCCGSLADPSTVTDGLFLPNGTQWNIGTVFWAGPLGADTITITLGTLSQVSSITMQADNNDVYGVRYQDAGGTWHDLTSITPHASWGLDMGSANFSPVVARAFQISSVGGDGYDAVSEFQAMGAPVPEPETYALMAAGLGVLGAFVRRRAKSAQG